MQQSINCMANIVDPYMLTFPEGGSSESTLYLLSVKKGKKEKNHHDCFP